MSSEILLKINELGAFLITEARGGIKQERPVAFSDIGLVFSKAIEMRSPLFLGTSKLIAYASRDDHERFIIADGPKVRNIKHKDYADGKETIHHYDVPFPGVILNVIFNRNDGRISGEKSRIFTYLDATLSPHTQLYKCPTFNVFDNNGICWGGVQISKQDVPNLIATFFASTFNNDLGRTVAGNKSIKQLFVELHKKEEFPKSELMSAGLSLMDLYNQ